MPGRLRTRLFLCRVRTVAGRKQAYKADVKRNKNRKRMRKRKMKKNFVKKLVTGILATALGVTALAGCGSAKGNDQAKGDQVTAHSMKSKTAEKSTSEYSPTRTRSDMSMTTAIIRDTMYTSQRDLVKTSASRSITYPQRQPTVLNIWRPER